MKALVLSGIFMAATSLVFAQPGSGQGSGPGQGMRMRIMDQLNLNEQQKTGIEKIHTEAMKAGIDRRAEIARTRVDLRQLFAAEKPDQSAIQKKMEQIANLRSAAANHRVDTWFAINKLLTPDQQKIWKQGLEQMGGMRGGMMGGMRGDKAGRGGINRHFDGPRGSKNRGPC